MRKRIDDRGVTLIETLIAIVVALIMMVAVGGVVFQATATSQNQGTETTRAVIYAQDKMEKLLSLGAATGLGAASFSTCTQAAGSQPAACNTTGITNSGWTQGLLAGGQIATLQSNCPTSGAWVGYVDFLDTNGSQLTGSCSSIQGINIAYVRQWQITDLSSSTTPAQPGSGPVTIKQVTVAVYSQAAVNTGAGRPIVIVSSLLSNPN